MASTTTIYHAVRKFIQDGTVDLDSDSIKVALLTSGYTMDAAHTQFGDMSAYEVSSGNGYVTGGQALANKVSSYSGATGKFTADNPVWSGLTKTFRYAVVYADKTANGVVKPVLLCILLDNTPSDVVVSAADYSIQWNAAGILVLN